MKFALKSYNSHQDEFVCIYDMDELSLYTSDCSTDGSLFRYQDTRSQGNLFVALNDSVIEGILIKL